MRVLEELNRRRMASASEIAGAIEVPRPTVHRLLLSLQKDGYARQLAGTEYFEIGGRVTALSSGWNVETQALTIAAPQAEALTEATGWPVDLSVYHERALMVRFSTHHRSGWSLLNSSPIGRRIPLIGTAPGRMYLAGLAPDERDGLMVGASDEERHAVDKARSQGFACRAGGLLPQTTAIAVGVDVGERRVLCISMAFMKATTVFRSMIDAFVPELTRIAVATRVRLS